MALALPNTWGRFRCANKTIINKYITHRGDGEDGVRRYFLDYFAYIHIFVPVEPDVLLTLCPNIEAMSVHISSASYSPSLTHGEIYIPESDRQAFLMKSAMLRCSLDTAHRISINSFSELSYQIQPSQHFVIECATVCHFSHYAYLYVQIAHCRSN